MQGRDWVWAIRLEVRRRQDTIRRAARVAMFCVLAILIIPLGVNFLAGSGGNEVKTAFRPVGNGSYEGTLSISKLILDPSALAISGVMVYAVTATQSGEDIDRVSLALQEDADHNFPARDYTSPSLNVIDSSGPVFQTNDGRPKGTVSTALEFRAAEIRPSAYYPFDCYALDLIAIGRATTSNASTRAGVAIATKQITLSLGQQQFSISQDSPDLATNEQFVRYRFRRPFFVWWVSIWVGVFLLFFLIYLLQLSEPKDLLVKSAGYFGTMWAFRQLVVPSAISIFPTAIDYFILLMFGILFIVVTFKVFLGQLGESL